MVLSRRDFVRGVGAALAGTAVAGGSFADILGAPAAGAATLGPTLPAGMPVLVMIELSGGHDILNTHIPWNVPTATGLYRAARPNMAVKTVVSQRPYGPPPAGNYLPPGLDLDGAWALHGSLPWMANRWWTKKDVAIVQGTGEDVAKEMSHFASMNYRWTGAFSGPLMSTGWLGRYNDAANTAQPLGGVSLSGLNPALNSVSTPAVAIVDVPSFGWGVSNISDSSRWLTDLIGMGNPNLPASLNKAAAAAKAIASADSAMARVKGVVVPGGSGNGAIAGQLRQAAALITAGVPCQTYTAGLAPWDLHGGAVYSQWDLLTQLDAALAGFFAVIDASSRANDVFVLITSEFGRQVTENSGGGTDHGRASSSILIGGGVKGGLYGQMPNLAVASRYYDAMVPTVDFRSVYATILNRLGSDTNLTAAVLGSTGAAAFADLGIFTSGPAAPQPPAPTTTIPSTTTQPVGPTSTMPPTTTPSTTPSSTMPPASTTTVKPMEPTTTMGSMSTTTMPQPTTTMKPTTTVATAPPTTVKA